MADVTWRIGAFAYQHPDQARQIGHLIELEDEATDCLFETAGQSASEGFGDPYAPYAGPAGCCGAAPCPNPEGLDTACSRGTCCCDDGAESFGAIYPELDRAMDEQRALAAAVRDILTDPDLEDIAGAIALARTMAGAGQLAALYAPAPPAKKLPDGSEAPARCPICGALVCPTCGCTCSCCDATADEAAPLPAGE